MILRPKSSPRHHGRLTGVTAVTPAAPIPGWLRRAVPDAQTLAAQAFDDVAITAGAAIGALDATVRRQERWAGAWRQRLALAAASVTARQAGRVEDEPALRDAVLLTRPGDDVGPAGKMLLAWRRLASSPSEELLTEATIAGVLEALGLARHDEMANELADELRQFATTEGAVGMLIGAFAAVERRGLPRTVGRWFADALLAQRLGWAHAVPVMGGEAALGMAVGRPRSAATFMAAANIDTGLDPAKGLLAAQARAALRAIDLSAELERRADRLLTVAPRLRARGADIVVNRLLSHDAIVASEKIAGMSARSLRRLFDRLVDLGAVRELSGRTTFRIYGI
ncbi:DUF1403 family protein [Mesorhizobium sp. M2A.F.Ca.ET.037.01.1.1]|uniref:DUF1403 family protein n=1 Tax=Mesorhizobium sp. M2A.F.Ca.ET.037.01.1.1 TaxID=2496748 RepID=UPI000FCB5C45|nr:DUF1403 family protein [Mesorhizobium sp. M2A.F.Ca.ET.037.01.1.1]RUX08646.1 DUF1403 family protein [Mesorhizobium sp. M2A.F.Ca.ET.037.01.1.1]